MRARLPVRLKVAMVSSALTFAILCLFAIVIGAVAEQRIRTGFDDDLRATAADLQDRLQDTVTREVNPTGEVTLNVASEPLGYAAAGDAAVRVVDQRGVPRIPATGSVDLGPTTPEGVHDVGGYRVVSRPLVAGSNGSDSGFSPGLGRPVAQTVRLRPVREARERGGHHDRKGAPVPRLRRDRRDLPRLRGRPVRGAPGHAPDLRTHARGARGGPHARPGRDGFPSRRPTTRYRTWPTRSRTCSAS